MKKNHSSLLLLLLLFATIAHAQQDLNIHGIVVDGATREPIAFAHIGMPDQGIGTTTNEQGEFIFNFSAAYLEETIEVSHIGYFNYTTTYDKLPLSESVTISLRPNAVTLEGVEVLEAEYPLTFYVKKAISNLKKNYPSKLHFMSGFYREAKINSETLHYDRLIEAAVDVQDKGLTSTRDNIRIQINELRKSDDFSDYSELNKQLEERFGDRNKMYDLFIRNPIRSYHVEETPASLKYNILELMQTHLDRLKLRDVTYKNNTKIYVIDYEDVIFSATLFIDSEDYGIHQLEFYSDLRLTRVHQLKKGTEIPIDRNQVVGINKQIFQYQKLNGQYYLSLIRKTSFDDFLKNKEKDSDKISSYAIRTLMINNFHTSKKEFDRIKWKEVEKKDISAYDIDMPYNEVFWKTFNILKLEPLNEEVKKDLEWASSLDDQFRKNGQKNSPR